MKINLPEKVITLAEPTSGENMWYTGADQDWGDIRIVRDLDAPADAKLWMQNNFVIEQDWDYGFVEVSTDGGTTWTELKVLNENGTEATTPDGYADPNGNMATFGSTEGAAKQYGLTGSVDGWKHQHARPRGVRGHHGERAPAARDRRGLPGARLVCRRLRPPDRWHHRLVG